MSNPPCHPLFWGSNSQENTHQQAQVKASRRDLVAFSEILCSPEGGSAQSAFVKDVLKAAFQVHAALAQKGFTDWLLTARAARRRAWRSGAVKPSLRRRGA